jgi:hypothetical protein
LTSGGESPNASVAVLFLEAVTSSPPDLVPLVPLVVSPSAWP